VHFIGIDPHKDTLAACAVDHHGRPVSHASFPNDPGGYADLVTWALGYRPDRIGVEGAGSLGRQATLALQRRGLAVVEVPPQLTAQARRRGRSQAKTDPIDALLIARITLCDTNLSTVRGDGPWRRCAAWSTTAGSCSANASGSATACTPTWRSCGPATSAAYRHWPTLPRWIEHAGCWPMTPAHAPRSPANG
jgi:hypothetical protein